MVDNKTGRQGRRYIGLTELIDPLLLKVNEGTVPFTIGTKFSHLNVEVNEVLERELCFISVGQALKIKTHYLNNTLSKSIILDLLSGQREIKKGLQLDC